MSRSLRPYLEYQADRVEAVLSAHRSPGRVTGGTVGPRLIRFFLNPAPHIRFASIKRLADDLALAMQVPTLSVDRGKEGVILEFSNPNPRPVTLLNLLPEVMPMPLATAMLGLTDDGAPLLARLSAPEVAHILVSGTTGSGKSALLKTIAASLALTHTPSLLQMLCIDPKGRTFPAFSGIPHLTRKPIVDVPEALEALQSVVRVMESRDRRGETPVTKRNAIVSHNDGAQGTSVPRIVIFIDELADLVILGEAPLSDLLTRLVQRGRQAGVHVIAATQHPSSAILSSVMRANFPLRLVGRVVSANDARVASGRAGTDAHLLNGRGDFLAVSGGENPIRFQVAYIDKKELKQQMTMLSGDVSSQATQLPVLAHKSDHRGGHRSES
ncbi:MAG: DNA translocase FtsK [Anaerolineae bacterium]